VLSGSRFRLVHRKNTSLMVLSPSCIVRSSRGLHGAAVSQSFQGRQNGISPTASHKVDGRLTLESAIGGTEPFCGVVSAENVFGEELELRQLADLSRGIAASRRSILTPDLPP
jgi:hypothetical protein